MMPKHYEETLGPDTAQVNAAFDELRGMMMAALLAGRLDEPMITPGRLRRTGVMTVLDRLSSFCGDKEWRVIAGLLARLAEHPDVTLRQPAAELLNKACSDYADTYAYDHAASQL